MLSERVLNYDDGLENLRNVEEMLDNAPEYQPVSYTHLDVYKRQGYDRIRMQKSGWIIVQTS